MKLFDYYISFDEISVMKNQSAFLILSMLQRKQSVI